MKNIQTVNRISFLELLKPHVTSSDLNRIEDAYTLSKYGHRNQLRDEGTRYFEHPKDVALIIISELKIYDPEIIIMALLHDIIEDAFILSRSGIERLFGKRVIDGLDYLTKVDSVSKYVKKMEDCDDLDVIVVKFADRLHNLRTLKDVSEEKRERKIKETKNLYLPLIERRVRLTKDEFNRNALLYLKKQILSNL